jgi:ACS family tartrate transporter-like MFS transporter
MTNANSDLLQQGDGQTLEREVLWKVALRLLPFLFLLYLVNILDRVNVGFARLQMLNDVGLSKAVYGWGAGLFYFGYLTFEVPSNLILHRMGARRWISRIMVSWGIISAAMMLVQDKWSFYALRFLLGVAEAGFFPGIILYLSYWFRARERARAVAFFMTASPLAGVLGNTVSGWIMEYMSGQSGLAGWQWLFLLEGLPAVILGIVVWFYLTDRPKEAGWLAPQERDWLAGRILSEEQQRHHQHGLHRPQALAAPRVWLLIAIYFTVAVGSNAYGFYLPKIVDEQFTDRSKFAQYCVIPTGSFDDPILLSQRVTGLVESSGQTGQGKFMIGLLAALPNLAAVIGMVLIGIHSDRTGERRLHVALSAFLAAVGWGVTASARSPWLVLLGLALAQIGMMSMLPTFWALPTSFLSGTAAAGGIALINSVANIGGAVGPIVLGEFEQATGGLTGGMIAIALTLFGGGLLTLCVRHDPKLERV